MGEENGIRGDKRVFFFKFRQINRTTQWQYWIIEIIEEREREREICTKNLSFSIPISLSFSFFPVHFSSYVTFLWTLSTHPYQTRSKPLILSESHLLSDNISSLKIVHTYGFYRKYTSTYGHSTVRYDVIHILQ